MRAKIDIEWHNGALIWTVWKDGRFIGSAQTYQEAEKIQTQDEIILHI